MLADKAAGRTVVHARRSDAPGTADCTRSRTAPRSSHPRRHRLDQPGGV